MKPLITTLLLAIIAIGLTACDAIKKAESAVGLTSPAQQTAFNVSLEQTAVQGVLELATNKPGVAATDTVNGVLDDLKNQVSTSTTAGKVTVLLTADAKQALADYQAKATKQKWLSDGASAGLQALTLAAPAAN